jgi:hypothetical protein
MRKQKWIWLILIFIITPIDLWLLNLAAFHTWASDRFLSKTAEAQMFHEKWSNIFASGFLLFTVLLGFSIWKLVKSKKA